MFHRFALFFLLLSLAIPFIEGNFNEPGIGVRLDRKPCPPISKPVLYTKVPHKADDVGKCIQEPDSPPNWIGVMSGIAALIPEAEIIAASLTILSQFPLNDGWTYDVNKCLERMFNHGLLENDLNKCGGRFNQIQTAKEEFLWVINQDLSNHIYLDSANRKLSEVTSLYQLIQNDFANSGDSTEDKHHEKFLDYVHDSLGTFGSMNLLLVDQMEKQMLPMEEICAEANVLLYDMDIRYKESFVNDGNFSETRLLEESLGSWIDRMTYTSYYDSNHYDHGCMDILSWYWESRVYDNYRGEGDGEDSFECTYCHHVECSETHGTFGHCELEHNGDWIDEFDDWFDYRTNKASGEVMCNYCQTHAQKTIDAKKLQIDEARNTFNYFMAGIREIQDRVGCNN